MKRSFFWSAGACSRCRRGGADIAFDVCDSMLAGIFLSILTGLFVPLIRTTRGRSAAPSRDSLIDQDPDFVVTLFNRALSCIETSRKASRRSSLLKVDAR